MTSRTSFKALSLLTLAVALAACGHSAPSVSQAKLRPPASPVKLGESAAPKQYFVELSGDPSDLSAQSVSSQQVSFRAQAKAQGIVYQELKSYSLLFNGFVVRADSTAKRQLEHLGGVVALYPVQKVQLPQTQVSPAAAAPQMFTARGMTGADIANNELGLTGKGVKVGVIDSGIDMEHPAFTGRIIKQHDFVGDAYNANDPAHTTPVPDENADDCGGHGTHVAGIVGGSDPATGFKGVAPEVLFGAYKVFGCEGSVDDPVILDAMELAVRDGMQVINMSLGSGYGWAESPLARAASRVIKRGVVMVNSQGNDGDTGQFSAGAPAVGDQVIAVGSVANVAFRLPKAVLSDGTEIGYTNNNSGHDAPLSGSMEVVKGPASSPTATEDGCTSTGGYAPNSLTGKVLLIRRGTCTFYEKAFNAQKAGAAVVLIYNRLPEHLDGVGLTPPTSNDPAITVPVISISGTLGAKIDAVITKGKTTLTWTKDTISIANPAGSTSSTFSSIGATPTLTFKPEVSAPGGSIYSTYPLSKTAVGYQTLSGTSMSSPHVAGAVALLLQAHPGLPAKNVVTLLQNTANPVSLRFNSTTYNGLLNYVQQQGAGMIDIPAAATTQVTATPSKLELGESQTFPTRLKVVVLKNSSNKAVTYTASHHPAMTIYGTTYTVLPDDENVASMTVNGKSVDGASTLSVTVPAGGETELNLAITAPSGADDLSQFGGYLVLKATEGSAHLSIPYIGFKGDYQAIPVLTDAYIGNTKFKFPMLIQRDADGDQDFAPTKPVYTLAEIKPGQPDQPYAFVHFNHQARKANLDALKADGTLAAELDRDQYMPRNAKDHYAAAGDDVWFTYSWDGKDSAGKTLLPNGDYKLRLRVLKPLGDESNPADWEEWVSPVFTLKHN
ncbi:peptidase S8 [Deinococcus irradiatisoli]|uniref:Peptidase S8 n=1 Tax=Deinococcus irradiatisoli TaxID=2202254 RepID=A0A2Z3JVC2_9DEIO|nr:peptidase S8 [Deinococcus irradiatisoli]